MFSEVLFLSIDQFKKVAPDKNTVVISILDRSENLRRPKNLCEFRDYLTLHFEDTYEELKLTSDKWADEPSEYEHSHYCQGIGERVVTLTDAKLMLNFMDLWQSSADKLTLIVHCFGGISRSAAVAIFASFRYGAPIIGHNDGRYANPRVLRLLDKAVVDLQQAEIGLHKIEYTA
jgi:predicted protein tyrosine phosphatase